MAPSLVSSTAPYTGFPEASFATSAQASPISLATVS